jgi:hypothetical protein
MFRVSYLIFNPKLSFTYVVCNLKMYSPFTDMFLWIQIYSLQYRIQHESIPLTEEKQILREIKQLEGTREKVIANAAMRTKLQDTMGQKNDIQDQVKVRHILL